MPPGRSRKHALGFRATANRPCGEGSPHPIQPRASAGTAWTLGDGPQHHAPVRVLPHIKKLDDCFGQFLVRVICDCGARREIEPEALRDPTPRLRGARVPEHVIDGENGVVLSKGTASPPSLSQ